jgi:hypothetical protein
MQAVRTITLAAALLAAATAGAAPVFHVGTERNTNGAYLFDWRGAAASVVGNQGRTEATVVTTGLQRLATLATPLSQTFENTDPDCPFEFVEVRRDVLQLAVTRLTGTENRGTSKVVDIGTDTTLSGCNAGRVVAFGDPADAGFSTRHLAASLRPSTSDLSPGVTLAGPSEQPSLDLFPAADVVSFGPGTMQFNSSGAVYPYSTVDAWLVNVLPSGERGHTRIAVDRNGAETWIVADWAGGQPQRVFRTLMVKPAPGAGFGGVRQASRIWESGLFIGTNTPFVFQLYRDGTGVRISQDLLAGTETRIPVTWGFDAANLVTTRTFGDGSTGRRTWTPLRNSGSSRFVMEAETRTLLDGTVLPFIAPRVNFYVDNGPATPPAPSR